MTLDHGPLVQSLGLKPQMLNLFSTLGTNYAHSATFIREKDKKIYFFTVGFII